MQNFMFRLQLTNTKLLQQLKSGFTRTINRNKYHSKASIEAQNPYLDFHVDPKFQGVKKLFVSLFENNADWTSYNQYFLPTVEVKDYNVMVNGKSLFDQPIKK